MTRERTTQMTRREATRLIGVSAAGLCLPVRALRAQAKAESSTMLTRAIPSTGEKLPVIGLGTWQAFDVDLTSDNRRQLGDVLSLFVKLGGRVIEDRKSTRLNSSHEWISYAVFCLKKKTRRARLTL